MLGPHIINDAANLNVLKKWQPTVITLLDPNPEYIKQIKLICPNTIILVRIYIPDNDVTNGIKNNPIKFAEYSNEITLTRYKSVLNLINYVQIANEVLQAGNDLDLLVTYENYRMLLADKNNYKCGIFAFSVGNPDVPAWQTKLTSALEYADKNNHCVLVHQYSKPPSMWTPDPDWHIHRLEHKVLPLLTKYNNLKFIVSEYGLDDLLYGNGIKGGYKKFITANEYTKQLVDISKYIYNFSDKILGYSIFTLGTGSNDWITYDINGEVAEQLANYFYANPVTPKWKDKPMATYKVKVNAPSGLNVRAEPNTGSQIVSRLPNNTIIDVTDFNTEWAKYNQGYVSKQFLTTDLKIDINEQLIKFAKDNDIDKYLLQALANIESGGQGFINGRLLIRLEAHRLLIFAPTLSSFFSFNPANKYFDHYYNGKKYHGNQDMEWEAFNFARRKHGEATYKSTSYGKFQILGENYTQLGFNSAEEMFNYLSQSETNQYDVFFRYLVNFGLIKPLQDYNFKLITEKYNGSGNVAVYSKLLQDEYNKLKPAVEIIIPEIEEPIVTNEQYEELKAMIAEDRVFMANLSNALNEVITRLDELVYVKPPVVIEPQPPNVYTSVDISNSLKQYVDSDVIKIYQGKEWKVKVIFTTANGSWDVSDHKFSIEQKYRDMFLKAMSDPKYLDKGGADHSIGFIVEDKNGNRLSNVKAEFKSSGVPPIIDSRYTDKVGHGDFPMFSGQNFDLNRPGPWSITIGDATVSGLGLYSNNHITTWILFVKQ